MALNIDQINTLVTQIEERGQNSIVWYGPQKPEDVDKCEELLQKKLPPTLRQFITQYGGGGIRGDELSGVLPNQDSNLGGTLVGDSARIQDEFGLPSEFLVIYSSDDEAVWCLDYTVEPDDEGELPVVMLDLIGYVEEGEQWPIRPAHRTFEDFLIQHLSHYNRNFNF